MHEDAVGVDAVILDFRAGLFDDRRVSGWGDCADHIVLRHGVELGIVGLAAFDRGFAQALVAVSCAL